MQKPLSDLRSIKSGTPIGDQPTGVPREKNESQYLRTVEKFYYPLLRFY